MGIRAYFLFIKHNFLYPRNAHATVQKYTISHPEAPRKREIRNKQSQNKGRWNYPSRKHIYITFTPFNPTSIQQNWGLQGYTLFFLFLLNNIDCGYSLELPRRHGSNEYPQSMFWAENWKLSEFLSGNLQFLVVKFSIYLNRRVFLMPTHKEGRTATQESPWNG